MKFTSIHSSSNGNLYTLEGDDRKILIEAGIKGKKLHRALNFGLSQFSGALVTHSDFDHSKGCMDVTRAAVDCYMSEETAKALDLQGHHIKIVEPLKQFTVSGFTILPFPTEHDCPGSLGFLIDDGFDKLVFITDSYYCKYKFSGLTHIAIECNWSHETLNPNIDNVLKHRLFHSHFNLERVLQFLTANDLTNVREIHLLHLSDDNSDEEMFIKRVQMQTGKPVYICKK